MKKALEALIEPLSLDVFLEKYFLKSAIKINAEKGNLKIDFTWDSVNEILNTKKVPYSKIKLFWNTNELPGVNDHISVLRHCANGGELLIADLESYDPFIREWAFSIADQVKGTIKTDLYTLYPSSVPANFRNNIQDIFIVQLEGRQMYQVARTDNELNVYYSCELQKGDILYIPRGNSYRYITSQPTLNLMFTCIFSTGLDFITWFINYELTEDQRFTGNFPLIFQKENLPYESIPQEWEKKLEELNKTFLEKLEDNSLMEKYHNFLIKNQQGSIPFVFPYPLIDEPLKELQNAVFSRPDYQDNIIENNKTDNCIDVFFWKHKISFELKFEEIIRYIFNNTFFTGKELLENKKDLPENDIVILVNKLIKQGIIHFQQS